MRAAIYARVSTKPKSSCPGCGKIVRLVENRLLQHVDRKEQTCGSSGIVIDSKADRGQDTENQLIQLREYCARQEGTTVEYVDRESGKTGEREQFQQLFLDATQRKFDV